jgi:hypothetical protein
MSRLVEWLGAAVADDIVGGLSALAPAWFVAATALGVFFAADALIGRYDVDRFIRALLRDRVEAARASSRSVARAR